MSGAQCFRHDLPPTGKPSSTTPRGKEGRHTSSPPQPVARNHGRSILTTHIYSRFPVPAKRRLASEDASPTISWCKARPLLVLPLAVGLPEKCCTLCWQQTGLLMARWPLRITLAAVCGSNIRSEKLCTKPVVG